MFSGYCINLYYLFFYNIISFIKESVQLNYDKYKYPLHVFASSVFCVKHFCVQHSVFLLFVFRQQREKLYNKKKLIWQLINEFIYRDIQHSFVCRTVERSAVFDSLVSTHAPTIVCFSRLWWAEYHQHIPSPPIHSYCLRNSFIQKWLIMIFNSVFFISISHCLNLLNVWRTKEML